MSNRHDKLGIKQTIQKSWMDRVVQMMLAGMSEKEIRVELNDYLSTQKQSGGIGERGQKTYGMAIGILSSWFSPDKDLVAIRNDLLKLAAEIPQKDWLPLHWVIISATYPFWFNVARQVGRLLNLQDQVTQAQIFNRLKEQYGDRETVSRNARYTVRSFVAWGVLKDSVTKGCYEKTESVKIDNTDLLLLMIESALLATPEGKGALNLMIKSPAFFAFHLPTISGDYIRNQSNRIDVDRYGLDDELLKLNLPSRRFSTRKSTISERPLDTSGHPL